nr:hypothetical protein CFP56_13286 [Quercus suber]
MNASSKSMPRVSEVLADVGNENEEEWGVDGTFERSDQELALLPLPNEPSTLEEVRTGHHRGTSKPRGKVPSSGKKESSH